MNEYIVKQGDTLQSIAAELFGDVEMVHYLASLNNIPPRFGGAELYPITPGQKLKTEVVEITAKKYPWGWIIGGTAAAAFAIYHRKKIAALFKGKKK